MRQIKPGMAFHQDNAYTKFWIYSREGQMYFVYPFRYPVTNMAGYRVPVDNFDEAITELNLAIRLAATETNQQ